tara:strand:+ start:3593 stop:4153 length:561 start_codon:yes stop_codon:yes gene_type:complete
MKLYSIKVIAFLLGGLFLLNSCDALKYRKVSAKDFPPDPKERVAKNIEEGRGFRLFDSEEFKSGGFDFATSNELWRASLDVLDFMPLLTANYSGGIIVTDWYNDGDDVNTSIKISVRFLTNEIRVDALDIKIFKKNCSVTQTCKTSEIEGELSSELKKSILKKAVFYEKSNPSKKKRKYIYSDPKD